MMTDTQSYSDPVNDDAEPEHDSDDTHIVAPQHAAHSQKDIFALSSANLEIPDWIQFWPV